MAWKWKGNGMEMETETETEQKKRLRLREQEENVCTKDELHLCSNGMGGNREEWIGMIESR